MPVILREVLELDVIRGGAPELLAGTDAALDAAVRWVHIGEVGDFSDLLEGGELLLTTGVSLDPASGRVGSPGVGDTEADGDADTWVRALTAASACGLVVELSERLPAIPAAVVDSARRHGLPLVALHRRVRFVAITEIVHRTIVDEQYRDLRLAQRAHETFTSLSLESASASAIVTQTARLADGPVVLEDLSRRVLAHALEGQPTARVLGDWQRRSRLAPTLHDAGTTGPEGWLTAPVGHRGEVWGRLVLPTSPTSPALRPASLLMLVERAAQALELGRMIERDRLGMEYQAHEGLLNDLLHTPGLTEHDALYRAQSLGVGPAATYVPVVVHAGTGSADDPMAATRLRRRLVELTARAVRAAGVSALTGPLGSVQVGLLVALPARTDEDQVLLRFADAVHEERGAPGDATVGVGRSATELLPAAAALRATRHIAEAAGSLAGPPRPYYRSADVRLRGLLSLMYDDPRVQAFAESELDRLLAHDAEHGGGLVDLLREFLAAGGNKSDLARRTHVSRPVLYKRLARIERLLGADLTDPETRTSLAVALLAHDQYR
ncbi:PucR family transcriptional regulator [Streptomyces sp. NPDC048172]|uniref:PucR family transcriptional regulator n=1 Tax=Streptomyces sp. NPDC048172 TaxID=3365505 RepID=UPI00371E14B5